MKLSRYLILGMGFLIATVVAAVATPFLPSLNAATEAILPSLMAVVTAVAVVSMVGWSLINELIGLSRADGPAMARPARFVRPQTGTPEVTAFG